MSNYKKYDKIRALPKLNKSQSPKSNFLKTNSRKNSEENASEYNKYPDKLDLDFPIDERSYIPYESIECYIKKINIRRVYNLGKIVGQGYFGIVRQASLITDPERKFAVKSINKVMSNKRSRLIENEVQNLMAVSHPNIVKLFEVYSDQNYIHLVFEHLDGLDLIQFMKNQPSDLNQDSILQIMFQMLMAVNYLHKQGICHRDLKPDNFMFETAYQNSNSQETTVLKLLDFGFTKKFHSFEIPILHGLVGTPLYMAPEVQSRMYNLKCDVWSLGIIFHQLLFGFSPYGSIQNEQNMLDIIKNREQFDFINHEFYQDKLSYEIRFLLYYSTTLKVLLRKKVEKST
eukprot:403357093